MEFPSRLSLKFQARLGTTYGVTSDADEHEAYLRDPAAQLGTYVTVWNCGNSHARKMVLNHKDIDGPLIDGLTRIHFRNAHPHISDEEKVIIANKPVTSEYVLEKFAESASEKTPDLLMALLRNPNTPYLSAKSLMQHASLDQMLKLCKDPKTDPFILLCVINKMARMEKIDSPLISSIYNAIRVHPQIGPLELNELDHLEENGLGCNL